METVTFHVTVQHDDPESVAEAIQKALCAVAHGAWSMVWRAEDSPEPGTESSCPHGGDE